MAWISSKNLCTLATAFVCFFVTELRCHGNVDESIQDLLQSSSCEHCNYATVKEKGCLCRCDELCPCYGDCCSRYPIANVKVKCNFRRPTCVSDAKREARYLAVSSCPNTLKNSTLSRLCEQLLDPVVGPLGVIYGNSACAICNDEIRLHRLDSVNQTRKCSIRDVINSCAFSNKTLWGYDLDKLCFTYNSPVFSLHGSRVYKNIFCALCNGVPSDVLTCQTPKVRLQMMKNVNLGFEAPLKSEETHPGLTKSNNIPAAFSILLNFGLDGKERMMFSSEGAEEMRRHQERCGNGFIWDPFALVCRQLFCSAQYVLVDFTCIPKPDDQNSKTNDKTPGTPINASSVQVTLKLQTEYDDVREYGKRQPFESLPENVRYSLSSLYKISPQRIQNITLSLSNETTQSNYEDDFDCFENITARKFTAELLLWLHEFEQDFGRELNFDAKFELLQPDSNMTHIEPSTEKIVSLMAYSVSLGALDVVISNMRTRVYAIHQNVNALETQWCNPMMGGRQVEYWNAEFHLILHDDSGGFENFVKEVYINKTKRIYNKGDFVANILFQGYNGNDNQVNVSGVVFVCEYSTLNETCSRVRLESNEYHVMPNGTLVYYGANPEGLILTAFETAENDSIYVCYDQENVLHWYQNPLQLNFDPFQAAISFICLCVSLVALGIVLFTYILFGSLRNLPGCNTMNLTFSLFLNQSIFLLSQRESVGANSHCCAAAGIVFHYFILASFFWMNVMAYDLYKTFGNKHILAHIRSKKKFLPRYLLYAYGTPLIIVCISTTLNVYETPLRPDYGLHGYCWMANPLAAFVFFAAPLAFIMLTNLGFYGLTIFSISAVQKRVKMKTKTPHGHSDAMLYIRMAVVVGLTWLFCFVAAFSRNLPHTLAQIFVYLFIVFNTLQGVFIFFAFVFNKRVRTLYVGLIRKVVHAKMAVCAKCNKSFCLCNYAAGGSAMRRTESTDTASTVAEEPRTLQ